MKRFLPFLFFPVLALCQTVQINQGAQTSAGVAGRAAGRTWATYYDFVGQAGVSNGPIHYLSTTGPTIPSPSCNQTAAADCEWEVCPTPGSGCLGAATFWYVKYVVPPGHTGTYTLSLRYRTGTTTGTAPWQPTYVCVGPGAVASTALGAFPAGTNATLSPPAALAASATANVPVDVVTTLDNVTCADNAILYVGITFTSNPAQAFFFSHEGLAIQGNP